MPVLDLSVLTCPLSLLELKRWLQKQGREQTLYLILRAGSADNQDILNWLQKQGIELLPVEHSASQHHYQLLFKDPR
ncbi:sulfurtransferase TusA family protein [Lacimicrobium sp. SS2-24]|uniref:sulfurtransferase TusA family protein n=1 Tax=Lacimicrobium sp. SS2-24 TaxID=2005569 RepID=UPI0014388B46|nr:sulfurtransferase TusA family protein [Lacimicrobium sp. SS2-24]